MIYPADIHTHHSTIIPGEAVINCFPETFAPRPQEWYSVGLHPWHVGEEFSEEDGRLLLLAEAAYHPQVVAIGEAGLDKLAHTSLSAQLAAFVHQARLAEKVGKPLIIHLVKAADELLKVQRELRPRNPWIVHGFRGKAPMAQMLLLHGFYLSFGERYQEEALETVPTDRLLLETDESTLPLPTLYERAAAIRRVPADKLMETVRQNVCRLFFTR